MGGETRCVRPPFPCRPSKLRLLVEAHRSPGCRISGFIPRHMLQPGSRHSNPASLKIRSSPSASACCLTSPEPGTTSAWTPAATFLPLAYWAARRKSSMRELVQEPINTLSILRSAMGVPGVSAIYSSACSAARRDLSSGISRGSGTLPSTPVTMPGLVPQVTCGAICSARSSTV